MLAEFFKALRDTAQERLTPVVTQIGTTQIVTHADGRLAIYAAQSQTDVRADCIESFRILVDDYDDDLPVYVGDEFAQVVHHDHESALITSRLHLDLCQTTLFAELADGLSLEPKAAVRWLRIRASAPQSVVDAMRRVDFTRRSDGSHTNDRQKESLGKSVEAAVQGRDELPEDMELRVRVWEGIDVSVTFRVLIDFDLQNQKILFGVREQEHADALVFAKRDLGRMLTDGTPRPAVLGSIITTPRYA